jgi:hypothetical protein
MIYDNAFTLVASMREHHDREGDNLRCEDDPMRRTLGFRTDASSWEISLTDLKRSMVDDSARADLLREFFTTPEGRQRLVDSINQGNPLL